MGRNMEPWWVSAGRVIVLLGAGIGFLFLVMLSFPLGFFAIFHED